VLPEAFEIGKMPLEILFPEPSANDVPKSLRAARLKYCSLLRPPVGVQHDVRRISPKSYQIISVIKSVLVTSLMVFQLGCGLVGEKGVGAYGEFCGAGRPAINESAPLNEKIAALEAVVPYDYIDCACKEHDLCYTRRGQNDHSCDVLLDYILDERGLGEWCVGIAFDIQAYFDYVHPNESWLGSISGAVLQAPGQAVGLLFRPIIYANAKSRDLVGQKCLFNPEQVSPWMARWKEKIENRRVPIPDSERSKQKVQRYRLEMQHGDCRAAISLYNKSAACGDPFGVYMIGQHTLKGSISGGEPAALSKFEKCAEKFKPCAVMRDMLLYKSKYVNNKYVGSPHEVCHHIGSSSGWLDRWISGYNLR
jgi:hypothetical protein